jgi:hypothetical protein
MEVDGCSPTKHNEVIYNVYVSTDDLTEKDEWIITETTGKIHHSHWESDESVKNCRNCNEPFILFWRRKHHCRSCGKIFCDECSKYRIQLKKKSLEERVCKKCYDFVKHKKETNAFWLVFMWLDFRDILKCMKISRMFHQLGAQYLKIMKKIACHPINQVLNQPERDILLNNCNYFHGHHAWILQICKIRPQWVIGNDFERLTPISSPTEITNCNTIYCPVGCKPVPSTNDWVQLLCYFDLSEPTRKFVYDNYFHLDTELALCLMPILILISQREIFLYGKSYMVEYILSMANPEPVIYQFIWELLDNTDATKHQLKTYFRNKLDEIGKDLFFKTNHTYQLFVAGDLSQLYDLKLMSGYDVVDVTNLNSPAEYKKSKSRPALLNFKTTSPHKPIVRFLYKNAASNVMKDYIVCKTIRLIIYILKQDMNLDIGYIHYDIYPLNDFKGGLIEVVEDSETIHSLRQKDITILNWIMDHNPDKTAAELRKKFTNSLAIYSVVTYVLGVGDRHLDNIMIHKSGFVFHIDFEFLLGEDPKIVPQTMRITTDMLDTIGGRNSPNYSRFKHECTDIFNCIRKHLGIIAAMLYPISEIDKKWTYQGILAELTKRCGPTEAYLNAETHITTIIESSHDTLTSSIVDSIYNFARQKFR